MNKILVNTKQGQTFTHELPEEVNINVVATIDGGANVVLDEDVPFATTAIKDLWSFFYSNKLTTTAIEQLDLEVEGNLFYQFTGNVDASYSVDYDGAGKYSEKVNLIG